VERQTKRNGSTKLSRDGSFRYFRSVPFDKTFPANSAAAALSAPRTTATISTRGFSAGVRPMKRPSGFPFSVLLVLFLLKLNSRGGNMVRLPDKWKKNVLWKLEKYEDQSKEIL
jgi:hypothetical protein